MSYEDIASLPPSIPPRSIPPRRSVAPIPVAAPVPVAAVTPPVTQARYLVPPPNDFDAIITSPPPGVAEQPVPAKPMRSAALTVSYILGALAVFLLHFRPWEGGLLEEWVLILEWNDPGRRFILDYMPGMLGRPLHLLWALLGFSITGASFAGLFFMLALVAVLTFFAASWALSFIIPNRWIRFALALALAIHPWWQAGMALRFLASMVAQLSLVFWFGCALKYLRTRRIGWLLLGIASILVGLLSYLSVALVYLIALLALFAVRRYAVNRETISSEYTATGNPTVGGNTNEYSDNAETPSAAEFDSRLRLIAVLTLLAVAACVLWTVVLAPRLGAAYETARDDSVGPFAAIPVVARVVALHGPTLYLLIAWLLLAIFLLFRTGHLTPRNAILLGLAAIGSLATALVFYTSEFWLTDIERVAMPIGLGIWLTACVLASQIDNWGNTERWLPIVLVAACIPGAIMGYRTWQAFGRDQQALLAAAQEFRQETQNERLVIEDTTGTFGRLYSLPHPYLDHAMRASYGRTGARVIMCVPDAIQTDEIQVPSCENLIPNGQARSLGTEVVGDAELEFFGLPVSLDTVRDTEPFRNTELGLPNVWWWLDDEATTFTLGNFQDEAFTTVSGEVTAAPCGDQQVEIMLNGDPATEIVVPLAAGQTAPFTVAMPTAITEGQLMIDPLMAACNIEGDARDLAVQVSNIRIDG